MIKIKWKKLKKIIKQIYNKDIDILLATNIDEHIYSATSGKYIYLNGNNIKSIEMVLKAIAHEMTHILYPKINEKTFKFMVLWSQIQGEIENKYKEEN